MYCSFASIGHTDIIIIIIIIIIISFTGTEHNGLTDSVNYTHFFKFRIR